MAKQFVLWTWLVLAAPPLPHGKKVSVRSTDGSLVTLSGPIQVQEDEADTWTCTVSSTAGETTQFISFDGIVASSRAGPYRSTDKEPSTGKTRYSSELLLKRFIDGKKATFIVGCSGGLNRIEFISKWGSAKLNVSVILVDDCAQGPCVEAHTERCVDRYKDFLCVCKDQRRYAGKTCEVVIPQLWTSCPEYIRRGRRERCECTANTTGVVWRGRSRAGWGENFRRFVRLAGRMPNNERTYSCRLKWDITFLGPGRDLHPGLRALLPCPDGKNGNVWVDCDYYSQVISYTPKAAWGPPVPRITAKPPIGPFLDLDDLHAVSLQCHWDPAECFPPPLLTWSGLKCASGPNVATCDFQPTLEDVGQVTAVCQLNNIALGQAERAQIDITVVFGGKPRVREFKANGVSGQFRIKENFPHSSSDVTLECVTRGSPIPEVYVTKVDNRTDFGGYLLQPENETVWTNLSERSKTFSVLPPTCKENGYGSGWYRCSAEKPGVASRHQTQVVEVVIVCDRDKGPPPASKTEHVGSVGKVQGALVKAGGGREVKLGAALPFTFGPLIARPEDLPGVAPEGKGFSAGTIAATIVAMVLVAAVAGFWILRVVKTETDHIRMRIVEEKKKQQRLRDAWLLRKLKPTTCRLVPDPAEDKKVPSLPVDIEEEQTVKNTDIDVTAYLKRTDREFHSLIKAIQAAQGQEAKQATKKGQGKSDKGGKKGEKPAKKGAKKGPGKAAPKK